MKIINGMKCKYKPFGEWENGEVVAVMDDDKFYVSDGGIKVAQYDDSLRCYTDSDIGVAVVFDESGTNK